MQGVWLSSPRHAAFGFSVAGFVAMATAQPIPHADLPHIALSVRGPLATDGTEAVLNAQPSTLGLELTGDTWADDVAMPGEARQAVLRAFESLHPAEPSGWAAVVAPTLNASTLVIERTSSHLIGVQLPQLPCYDLLRPEIVMVRIPGAAITSGRSVVAPPLRIGATAVTPPRWGSVRSPPREVWRNCTHVQLSWLPPYSSGGTALHGYRIEMRRVGAGEDSWNSSALIEPPAEADEVLGVAGELEVGVSYEIRIRAYSVSTGCVPVAGDDGAPLLVHGGWRTDSLHVAVGPAGGSIVGGAVVLVRGACMQAASACAWGGAAAATSAELGWTSILEQNESLLSCTAPNASAAGDSPLWLSSDGAGTANPRPRPHPQPSPITDHQSPITDHRSPSPITRALTLTVDRALTLTHHPRPCRSASPHSICVSRVTAQAGRVRSRPLGRALGRVASLSNTIISRRSTHSRSQVWWK